MATTRRPLLFAALIGTLSLAIAAASVPPPDHVFVCDLRKVRIDEQGNEATLAQGSIGLSVVSSRPAGGAGLCLKDVCARIGFFRDAPTGEARLALSMGRFHDDPKADDPFSPEPFRPQPCWRLCAHKQVDLSTLAVALTAPATKTADGVSYSLLCHQSTPPARWHRSVEP